MEIIQKKGAVKSTFDFTDEKLKYSFKESSGKNTFSVDYDLIPHENFSEIEEKNAWFRNLGILWSLLGLALTAVKFYETGTLSLSIWVTIGFICLLVYWFSKTSYTVLDTSNGRILILKDKKHDKVLRELDARRRKQWNDIYNKFDMENDPNAEINKFKWLKEQGVIDENEFQDRVKEISQFHELHNTNQDDNKRILN